MILRSVGVMLLLMMAGAGPARAQTVQAPDRLPWTVTVTGEATVAVIPDMAEVRAGVLSQGRTAREVSEANSRAMAALLAMLKATGVADTDIRTSRFSIQPMQVPDPSRTGPPRITGFQASNQIAVTIHDIATVGDVIDKLAGAGANEFSGVLFQVSAPSKALDGARTEAIADARRKAEIYARAAGSSLGGAIAIAEDGANNGPVTFRASGMQQAGTPIAPGEETLRVGVTVTFELVR